MLFYRTNFVVEIFYKNYYIFRRPSFRKRKSLKKKKAPVTKWNGDVRVFNDIDFIILVSNYFSDNVI